MQDLNYEDLYEETRRKLKDAEMKIEYMTSIIDIHKTKQNIGGKE